MGVGIVAAFPAEGECLTGSRVRPQTAHDLAGGARLLLSGVGPHHAAAAAESLLASGYTCLVSWGMAAGIDPALKPGTLCLPTHIITETGASFDTSAIWRENLLARLDPMQPSSGALFQSNRVISTAQEKSRIRAECQAVALDMESGAIAQIAARDGLPFLAVRAVADDAAMNLPEAARQAMDPSGRLQLESVLRRILQSPGDIAGVWELARGFRAAKRALRQAAWLAGSNLGAPTVHIEEGTS